MLRKNVRERLLAIVGDMCDLQFKKGPFEVSFELAGTCGIIPDKKTFQRFLRSVVNHTSSQGIILLTVFFHEMDMYTEYPWLVGEWGPFGVYPQGKAWLKYEVLSTEPELNLERVRRTVNTEGVAQCSCPLIDEYNMYSWSEESFWQMISRYPSFHLCSFRYDEPEGIVCHKRRTHRRSDSSIEKIIDYSFRRGNHCGGNPCGCPFFFLILLLFIKINGNHKGCHENSLKIVWKTVPQI